MKNHNITEDLEYLEEDVESEIFQDLDNGNKTSQLYLKFDYTFDDFNVFTSKLIEEGEVLGYITGVITANPSGLFKEYNYPSKINNIELYLDVSEQTNILSFIREGFEANCEMYRISH